MRWGHKYFGTTLGEAGLSHLETHVERFTDKPLFEAEVVHEAIIFLRELRGEADQSSKRKKRFIQQCLQEIATAKLEPTASSS